MENIDVYTTELKTLDMDKAHEMMFLYNVLQNGWSVKKLKNGKYICSKKHEGNIEFFSKEFLKSFMETNFNDT